MAVAHNPLTAFFKAVDRRLWELSTDENYEDHPMGLADYTHLLGNQILTKIWFSEDEIIQMIGTAKVAARNAPESNYLLFPSPSFYDTMVDSVKGDYSASEIFRLIFSTVARHSVRKPLLTGFKEIFIANLLPLLFEIQEFRTIFIVRDPREVAFSRNYVESENVFGNLDRHPVKMVALAWLRMMQSIKTLQVQGAQPVVLRFEDLASHPEKVWIELRSSLNLDQAPFPRRLLDEEGGTWKINTSAQDGRPGFGARWPKLMPHEEVAVIEAICGESMDLGGFPLSMAPENALKAAKSFSEDASLLRPWTRRPFLLKL